MAAAGKQLFMAALFHDHAFFNENNAVGGGRKRQVVGNQNRG